MANYNKSFNFRNGVQVDNDNFVVNANGLVGIGTTIPTDFLDVYGTSKFNDPIRGTNITLSGVTSTTRLRVGIVSITSGIITASSGIVTYYGDGGKLLNLPTSQWIDVDPGFGYESIYSAGNVGIATTNPDYSFQVGSNPNTASGVGFNSTGSIKASGIITAYSFSGFGTDIQGINAFNISNGTLNNSRLPQNISVSGIITASTNFSGNLTGNVNSTGLSTFSGGISGNLTGNVNSTGLSTFSGGISGNVNSTGLSTFSGGISGNLTGNVNSTGLSTFSGGISGNLTGNVNSTGLSTFSGGISGNLTGIASTARSLTGTPDISVGVVTTTKINIGTGGTIFSALNSGRIGIGTAIPTSELQIRKPSGSLLEVISDSGEARISIGQNIGVGNSTGLLRFGFGSPSLDIINNDIGNINFILHDGFSGINTGTFNWVYGQSNESLMSLTHDKKLGIGKTNPEHTLHVVGTSTVTLNAFFGGDVSIGGTLSANTFDFGTALDNRNFNVVTGISTFNIIRASKIGINSSIPMAELDVRQGIGLFSGIGIGTTTPKATLAVSGTALFDAIGIGTTVLKVNQNFDVGNFQVHGTNLTVFNAIVGVDDGDKSTIGFATFSPKAAIDFSLAGNRQFLAGRSAPFMVVPIVTSTILTGWGVGKEGSIVYNSTTKKHQGWGSTDGGSTFKWNDLY